MHRLADHETEIAARPPPRPLRARDPITGLCDLPEVIALVRLILGTPALLARRQQFIAAGEHALAEALRDTAGVPLPIAGLAAAQISGVQWALSMGNQTRMAAGVNADDAFPEALALAEEGFRVLAYGLTSADL